MKDYKKEALEYIDKYIDIVDDFATGEYNDIGDLIEYLAGGAVRIETPDGLTEEEEENEIDRYLQEIHAAVEEHAEEIKKGLLIKQIIDVVENNPGILELYNNNIWSVYYELGEAYNTLENLNQINKNLGGEAVKI